MQGLKVHQRSCRVLQGLNENLLQDLEREITNTSADVSTTCKEGQMDRSMQTEISTESYLMPGIKLPETSWEWEAANGYLQAVFSNQPMESDHLDWHIRHLNGVMYDSFQKTTESLMLFFPRNIKVSPSRMSKSL